MFAAGDEKKNVIATSARCPGPAHVKQPMSVRAQRIRPQQKDHLPTG